MKNLKVVVVTALLTVAWTGLVYAHGKDPSPEEAAYIARDGLMHLIVAQRGILRDMADGKKPVVRREFVRAANTLAYLFSTIPGAFEKNVTVADSRSKPEIWQNWDDFVAKAQNLRVVAAEIAAIADISGVDAAKDKIADIDCGSCHTPYRK